MAARTWALPVLSWQQTGTWPGSVWIASGFSAARSGSRLAARANQLSRSWLDAAAYPSSAPSATRTRAWIRCPFQMMFYDARQIERRRLRQLSIRNSCMHDSFRRVLVCRPTVVGPLQNWAFAYSFTTAADAMLSRDGLHPAEIVDLLDFTDRF